MKTEPKTKAKTAVLGALATALCLCVAPARAEGMLEGLRHHTTLASTITDNGDLNPYAVFVAPASMDKIHAGDVLVDNFNNQSNLQGAGGTIIGYSPASRSTYLFAKLPQTLPQCPGGIGLSTAMAVLSSGWVIVGSTPSKDGTTGTKGPGCLLVFDANGKLATVWSGSHINDPWGNMAVVDNGAKATLFVSMSGYDVPGPDKIDPATGLPVVVNKATVLRIQLATPPAPRRK